MTIQKTQHKNDLITEALSVAQSFATLTTRLNDALAVEITLNRDLSRAKKALEAAEAELVTQAVMQAQTKQGPLAGVALTSPAFKDAREALLVLARTNHIKPLYASLQQMEIQVDDALIARQQLENQWHAARTAANVFEAILQSLRK